MKFYFYMAHHKDVAEQQKVQIKKQLSQLYFLSNNFTVTNSVIVELSNTFYEYCVDIDLRNIRLDEDKLQQIMKLTIAMHGLPDSFMFSHQDIQKNHVYQCNYEGAKNFDITFQAISPNEIKTVHNAFFRLPQEKSSSLSAESFMQHIKTAVFNVLQKHNLCGSKENALKITSVSSFTNNEFLAQQFLDPHTKHRTFWVNLAINDPSHLADFLKDFTKDYATTLGLTHINIARNTDHLQIKLARKQDNSPNYTLAFDSKNDAGFRL